ncbi:transcription elongation factor TFIIS [Ricinus communis]|uniref:transcription elongation factor TFIIS n=1 Tax=Ricinus communis TaxID=3988 RepID=UPI00201AED87|nr:transcription elongation factor TFIIS [Ricinus communis]
MEEQLVDLYTVAWKSSRSAALESKCLNALSRLRCFPITFDVLASIPSVDVFRGFKALTKHPNVKIVDLSARVIAAWCKKLLKQLHRYEDYVSSIQKQPCTRTTAPSKDQTSQVVATVSKEAKIDINANPRTVKALKVQNKSFKKVSRTQTPKILTPHPHSKAASIPKSSNSLRDSIREQISQALSMVFNEAKHDTLKTCDPIQIAASLESALFVKWGVSNTRSRTKYRSLLFNIKDPKNPDFRRKILVGEIKAEEVAEMDAGQMASDEMQRKNQGIQAKSLWKCIVGREQEGTTDQFKCGKCGEKRTTYYQMQTRSADEPMTTYVTCTICDNHWKFC